jgi:hypothetical protein
MDRVCNKDLSVNEGSFMTSSNLNKLTYSDTHAEVFEFLIIYIYYTPSKKDLLHFHI